MSETTLPPAERRRLEDLPAAPAPSDDRRRWYAIAGVLVLWVLGWAVFQGKQTLEIATAENTDFHRTLLDIRDEVEHAARDQLPAQLRDRRHQRRAGLDRHVPAGDVQRRGVPAAGARGRLAGRGRARGPRRLRARWCPDRRAGRRRPACLRLPRLLAGLDRPAHHHRRRGRAVRAAGAPAGDLDGAQQTCVRPDHPGPRRDADDAVVRLPGTAGAVLRHRPGVGGRHHAHLRDAAAGPDLRARAALRRARHRRGEHLARLDLRSAAAHRAAADGAPDDPGGPQPDHDGGPVDGHHRDPDQRAGPRPAGARGTADQRRRRRHDQRPVHRADRDHARPHDDGRRCAHRDRAAQRPGPPGAPDRPRCPRGRHRRRDLRVAPVPPVRRVPGDRVRQQGGRLRQHRQRRGGRRHPPGHPGGQGRGHLRVPQPAAVVARRVAVLVDGRGAARAGVPAGRRTGPDLDRSSAWRSSSAPGSGTTRWSRWRAPWSPPSW